MPDRQDEFVFDEVQKTEDQTELPKRTHRPNGEGKILAQSKSKKKQRSKPAGMQSAPASRDRSLPPPTMFLSDREVARRYGVSRPTIWRWVKEVSDFPSPNKIAKGTTRWHLPDLEAHERICGGLPTDQTSRPGAVK